MKNILLFIFILSCYLFSCKKPSKTITNGSYIGTFERNGTQVPVQLMFSNGQFSGVSDSINFPAICSGTYTVSGNTISFENGCMWTANFDWTLILSENWTINSSNNSLILTKANGDEYNLIHQ